jgi:hypothetical protein
MALNAEGAKVGGAVLLRDGFVAEGQVRLYCAEIGGNLACNGGTFQEPAEAGIAASGRALDADGARVAGSVLLHKGFAGLGKVLCCRGTGAALGRRN